MLNFRMKTLDQIKPAKKRLRGQVESHSGKIVPRIVFVISRGEILDDSRWR